MAAADAYGRLKLYDARRADRARGRGQVSRSPPRRSSGSASSLERGGNPAEGEKVFLQLLAMRPNDSATQNYLGYMWADQGVQLEKARDMLEKAVAREPRNAAYLDSLGWAYFRLGELQSADKNLREAYRREPADPTIEEHIGDLEARQGNMRGGDPPLGEGSRAQARGARPRAGKAPKRARRPSRSVEPRAPLRLPLPRVPALRPRRVRRRTAATQPGRPGDRRAAGSRPSAPGTRRWRARTACSASRLLYDAKHGLGQPRRRCRERSR